MKTWRNRHNLPRKILNKAIGLYKKVDASMMSFPKPTRSLLKIKNTLPQRYLNSKAVSSNSMTRTSHTLQDMKLSCREIKRWTTGIDNFQRWSTKPFKSRPKLINQISWRKFKSTLARSFSNSKKSRSSSRGQGEKRFPLLKKSTLLKLRICLRPGLQDWWARLNKNLTTSWCNRRSACIGRKSLTVLRSWPGSCSLGRVKDRSNLLSVRWVPEGRKIMKRSIARWRAWTNRSTSSWRRSTTLPKSWRSFDIEC